MQPTCEPRLLLDGYNVLFQSSLVGTDRSSGWLQRARYRLLALLDAKLTEHECQRTQVVFDAAQLRSATEPSFIASSGVCVTFALDHDEADDLIEHIIRKHSHAKKLRVVSSDHRIRRCAGTRKALSVDSETFLEELESKPTLDKSHTTTNRTKEQTKLPKKPFMPHPDLLDELPTEWLDALLLGDGSYDATHTPPEITRDDSSPDEPC